MVKKILHSIKNLPRNLRTIRPFAIFEIDRYTMGLGLGLDLDLDPPHPVDDYPLHFTSVSLYLQLGPVYLELGLADID